MRDTETAVLVMPCFRKSPIFYPCSQFANPKKLLKKFGSWRLNVTHQTFKNLIMPSLFLFNFVRIPFALACIIFPSSSSNSPHPSNP